MDIKSVGTAGLSQSGSQCPPENPSPFTYSRSKPFCGALRTWPVPAAVCSCSCPPMGMQVPCIPICAPPSCAPHQGAGRCWPLAWPFFVFCAPTEEFTLKKNQNRIGAITNVTKGVFIFLPNGTCFHFQACLIYVWFSRCKTDPWGQAVQVFYFSHHCTRRRTEFGIAHIIWGKSLLIHAIFENSDFSYGNTKKKTPFLLQRAAVGPGNTVGCERTRFPITRSSL